MNDELHDRFERTLTATLREVAAQTTVDTQATLVELRADLIDSSREPQARPIEQPGHRRRSVGGLAVAGLLVAIVVLVVAGLGRLSSDQQIEVGPAETTIVDEATLRVLSTSPPPGFSLDFATALPADTEPADCVGCVDLWIVPRDWIPVGVSDLMTVAVEPPGFTNTPDAEQLTIRGADATLGTIGEITKLAWTESAGTSVVVTFGGYSRDEAIVVAEGLIIADTESQVRAEVVPEGAKAVPELLGGPTTMMQYSNDDGQRIVVQAFATDQLPTDEVRNRLSPPDFVIRPEGVGSADPARPERGLVWWSNDGLVFRLDRTNNDLDVEQLADFAVTLDEVSDTQWAELGGR